MMKRTIFILILLVMAVLVWVAVPRLMPETWTLKAEITIQAPEKVVFVQLNDLRNWEIWSPWHRENEPANYMNGGFGRGGAVLWQTGTDLRQRFIITQSDPHHSIEIAMDFRNKGFGVSRIELFRQDAEKTLVRWNYGMKTEGWKSLMARPGLMKTIRKALNNLSSTAGFWHEQKLIVVEPGMISDFPFVSIRRQIAWDDLSDEMGRLYELLVSSADEGGYHIIGHPYAIYHSMGEDKVDIECGYPIEKQVPAFGIISSGIYNEAMCAMTEYTGSFETLEKGHEAVQQWMESRNLTLGGSPMEIFINNQSAEWTTKICYPIELPE